MFGEEKNLKDSSGNPGLAIKDTPAPIAYNKTNKLITALYMVTDIISTDEPLRKKLRTAGVAIISDINTSPLKARTRIAEIISFLDIASAMNIISEMNCNILRKEFSALDQAIKESTRGYNPERKIDLVEFLREDPLFNNHPAPTIVGAPLLDKEGRNTRIGVQKGSTLMQAIKDKTSHMSEKIDFTALKTQRRQQIIRIVKNRKGDVSIKDIANALHLIGQDWGEKTLQRELVSMVHDGVLKKTGEKRWSRYFLALS